MKVAIIGAMEEEVALLKSKLEGRKDTVVAGYEFYEGTLNGVQVILLRSGIGKVNAAISTTILNQVFKPDYVINTGSAGGLDSELNVGDVVISSEVRHHDVDVTVFGYEYGQIPQMPAAFLPDNKLVDVAENCAKNISDKKVLKGLIVSGDSFMSDADRVAFIKEKLPGIYAVEMEAAGVAQVCYQFNVPFVIIRAISDVADKEANLSFEQFLEVAAKHSAELIMEIVKELRK
jgi:adenosylhomocysteine nucleosidase